MTDLVDYTSLVVSSPPTDSWDIQEYDPLGNPGDYGIFSTINDQSKMGFCLGLSNINGVDNSNDNGNSFEVKCNFVGLNVSGGYAGHFILQVGGIGFLDLITGQSIHFLMNILGSGNRYNLYSISTIRCENGVFGSVIDTDVVWKTYRAIIGRSIGEYGNDYFKIILVKDVTKNILYVSKQKDIIVNKIYTLSDFFTQPTNPLIPVFTLNPMGKVGTSGLTQYMWITGMEIKSNGVIL